MSKSPKRNGARAGLSTAQKRELNEGFERSWGWAIAPVLRLKKDIRGAAANPSRTKARIESELKRGFEERLAQLGEEAFLSDYVGEWMSLEAMQAIRLGLPGFSETHRRKTARQPFRARPLALMFAAHARVPFSPFLAYAHPQAGFEPALDTASRAFGLVDAVGRERRARLLAEFAGAYAEGTYRPYLEEVRTIARLADGVFRQPGKRMTLGALVNELLARPDTTALVEPECARVRNAVKHHDFTFDPRDRVLVLTDRESGPSSRKSFGELRRMLERMRKHVEGFEAAKSDFYLLALGDVGIMDLVYRLLIARKTKDTSAEEAIGRQYKAFEKNMLDGWATAFAG